MRNTEIAKHLQRERKQEIQREARVRRRELSTPSIARGLQREKHEIKTKFEALPEDARSYVECVGHSLELMERAIRTHERVCLTCPPSADRTPSDGSEETMDDYIKAFVEIYCALEELDHAEVVAVH
jgi:hypothetical protein